MKIFVWKRTKNRRPDSGGGKAADNAKCDRRLVSFWGRVTFRTGRRSTELLPVADLLRLLVAAPESARFFSVRRGKEWEFLLEIGGMFRCGNGHRDFFSLPEARYRDVFVGG
jgi:hypothetical protein